jgi:hypothetical protein
MEGKLLNGEGEFIASGPCEIDRDRNEVTMWPSWELHMLERERGALKLELENGATLDISDRHLTFKLRGPSEQRVSVYRLRIIEGSANERVPEHLAAGYVDPREDARATDTSDDTANIEMASGDAARIDQR